MEYEMSKWLYNERGLGGIQISADQGYKVAQSNVISIMGRGWGCSVSRKSIT